MRQNSPKNRLNSATEQSHSATGFDDSGCIIFESFSNNH